MSRSQSHLQNLSLNVGLSMMKCAVVLQGLNAQQFRKPSLALSMTEMLKWFTTLSVIRNMIVNVLTYLRRFVGLIRIGSVVPKLKGRAVPNIRLCVKQLKTGFVLLLTIENVLLLTTKNVLQLLNLLAKL